MAQWKPTILSIIAVLPVLMQCKAVLPLRTAAEGGSNATAAAVFTYVADAFDDSSYNATGVAGQEVVGGTPFEIYGMAYEERDGYLYVAINSNLGPEGVNLEQNNKVQANTSGPYSGQRHIAFGDLIFNFAADQTHFPVDQTGTTNLFGVHFAAGSETKLTDLGLYQAVKTTTYTSIKDGFPTLNDYYNRITGAGKTPVNGQLASNDPYFDASLPIVTSIATGTRVTDDNFALLSATDLAALGLDFPTGLKATASSLGSKTFGFKIKKPAGMNGAFTANLTMECGNDIIAFRGTLSNIVSQKILVIKKFWVNASKSLDSTPPATIDVNNFAIIASTSAQTIRCSYAATNMDLTCVQTSGTNAPVLGLDISNISQYTVQEVGLPADYSALSGIGSFVVGAANDCTLDTTRNITVCEHRVTNTLGGGSCPVGMNCGCSPNDKSCNEPPPVTPCVTKDCTIPVVPPTPTPCVTKDCVIVTPVPTPCIAQGCATPCAGQGPTGCCGFLASIFDKIYHIFTGCCGSAVPVPTPLPVPVGGGCQGNVNCGGQIPIGGQIPVGSKP